MTLLKKKRELDMQKKKQMLQVKLVCDMTPSEHRNQRGECRECKSRSRLNKKCNQNLLNHLRENSPKITNSDAACNFWMNLPEENMVRLQSVCFRDSTTQVFRSTPLLIVQNEPSFIHTLQVKWLIANKKETIITKKGPNESYFRQNIKSK